MSGTIGVKVTFTVAEIESIDARVRKGDARSRADFCRMQVLKKLDSPYEKTLLQPRRG